MEAAAGVKPELPSPAKQARKSALSFLLDDDDVEISKVEPPLSLEEQANREISKYREEPNVQSNTKPLQFWITNAIKFPLLSKLVKIYLCAQASSVASEKVFSTAGDIVTSTRSCLDPEHVDQLTFLKKNFKNEDLAAVLRNI